MEVTIMPGKASGEILAPPSKSMAHRMLISAGLSKGTSIIHNISLSQDILATLDCLTALGAEYTYDAETLTVTLRGVTLTDVRDGTVLPTRESGSTLRFFTAICLLTGKKLTLKGAESLFRRPLSIYEEIAEEDGFLFSRSGSSLTVSGTLKPRTYEIDGSVSSQFITGLLFSLPLLPGDSTLKLLPPVESSSYIHMTIEALRMADVHVTYDTEHQVIQIPGNQKYRAGEFTVEGDYSNAAFLDAFNLLQGHVTVTGLNPNSLQGDQIYQKYYQLLQEGTPTLDLQNCPDLGPILFTLAALLHGARFIHTRRLKIKESDRAQVMKDELSKVGASVLVYDDEVIVEGTELHAPKEPFLDHLDHRVVMSMAVLSSVLGGTILGAEAVRKSYPDFFTKIKTLHLEVIERES